MEDNIIATKNISSKNGKEKQRIFMFYVVFFLSIFVIFVPISFASVFAVMINVCTLATIYSVRMHAEEDSLTENQMTFLIRTFWRANLYFLFSGTFSLLYLTIFTDYAPLIPCIVYIDSHLDSIMEHWRFGELSNIMRTCNQPFFKSNEQHLVITAFIAFFPILLYLLFRCLKGWALVTKDKIVPETKL